MKRPYVDYKIIASCFPEGIAYDEASLRKLGYREHPALPFVLGGSPRKGMWRVGNLISHFANKYKRSPELVESFCEALIAKASK